MLIERPPELAVLPAGYGPLFDRAASVFAADARLPLPAGPGRTARTRRDLR